MPVTEVVQALGRWELRLKPDAPLNRMDSVGWFGHIAFIPGRLDDAGAYRDNLLSRARYVGVVRGSVDTDSRSLRGCGMGFWLGDEDDKGSVLESAVNLSGAAFPDAVRALLPASGAVTEGTLSGSVAGTYTGFHQWQTPRKAISYVCDTMSTESVPVEWRVNSDGTLDAGPVSELYAATPRALVCRRKTGRDVNVVALPGNLSLDSDVEDFTTRVVLLAEGESSGVYTGSADIASNPYKDIHGNPVAFTRLVSEAETSAGNATQRASLALSQFLSARFQAQLSTSAYDVKGDVNPGDYLWVYDPVSGFVDTDNEVYWDGEPVWPLKLRCIEMSWPVPAGWTVAYRNPAGGWLDLSDYYVPEAGDTSLVVGTFSRSLIAEGQQIIGTRPVPDTTVPAAPAWDLPFVTVAYMSTSTRDIRASVTVQWTAPANTDGTTVIDGANYELQYRQADATEWTSVYIGWGAISSVITELTPGVQYVFRVRAADCSTPQNVGAWSVEETVTAAQDEGAPATPAAPTVAGSRIAVQVTHTLGRADTGGTFDLDLDLDHLEVHVGTPSSFTPSASTLKGRLTANAGLITAGIPAVGTFQVEQTTGVAVKVIAVDSTGNKSPASAPATVTAELIDDAHISDLTVSKVTAGTLSAEWILAGSIKTATTGRRVEIDSNGVNAYNLSGVNTVQISSTGIFQILSDDSGARMVINNSGIYAYDSSENLRFSMDANTGDVLVDGVFRTSPSGARVEIIDDATVSDQPTAFFIAAGADSYSKAGYINAFPYEPAGSTSGTVAGVGINGASYLVSGATYHPRITLSDGIILAYVDENQDFITGINIADAGGIQLLNPSGVISIGATGRVDLYNPNGQLTIDTDGTWYAYGQFTNIADSGLSEVHAIHAGAATCTSGASSISFAYGLTLADTPIPVVNIRDNIVHAMAITANSTTGFGVTIDPAADGEWRIYWHTLMY